jgi:integrase
MAYIEKRTSQSGDVSYRVMVRLKGYKTQNATFERITDAKQWAIQTEAAMKERRYFKTAESKKHSLSDLIDRYLTQLEVNNPKRHGEVYTYLQWWKQEMGHCLLSDITKSQLVEKIESLTKRTYKLKSGKTKKISPATVNRYIMALSKPFTLAVNEWEWMESHPLLKITKLKEPRGRVRFLNDDERDRLLAACKGSTCPVIYTVVVLALSTGARLNEIMSLSWKDVDFSRNSITLHETKNGERRMLPLAGLALKLVKETNRIRRIDSDLVFPAIKNPKEPYKIRRAWNVTIKQAKLADFRFHDLRHSAASYLAMNGASLAEIAEVLGHKTLQMVKRYAHLSEAHTSKVVASMNKKIFG